MKTKDFRKLIKEHFKPRLINLGFKGNDHYFVKHTNEHYIYTLVIQANKYGDSCLMEVGVHLDFLPNTINEYLVPENITTYDSEFRKRILKKTGWLNKLLNQKNEDWFMYGNDEEEAIKTLDEMYKLFQEEGLKYFNQFRNFPEPLISISLGELKERSKHLEMLGAPLDLRLALVIARIHKFLGDLEKADEYARWGLANIKNATGLIKDFEGVFQRSQ